MKKESIELVIIFDGRKINATSIVTYFNSILNNLYEINFHEISYSVMQNGKLVDKTLKYNEKNIKKIDNDFAFNGFELINLMPEWAYKSTDIKFSIMYNTEFTISKKNLLVITLNKYTFYNKYNNKKLVDLYLNVINFLKGHDMLIVNGFIFSMDNEKFPGMFVGGISNDNLSSSEEKELENWGKKRNEVENKIWNIFWGNLITIKHLKTYENLKKIKLIVGEENYFPIDESTYFFNLPTNNMVLGEENRNSKRELLTLLNT